MYFISLADSGPPNVAGPGVAYPLPHPLDGSGVRLHNALQSQRTFTLWQNVVDLISTLEHDASIYSV